jgi:hypothetical protein
MITGFITFYNILRTNKSKICWLNLDNGEGLNTALIGLIIDGFFTLFVLWFINLIKTII